MDWKSLSREAPEWFRDAKFGLFFHWGPYSVPAFENEWYSRNMYAKGRSQHRYHTAKYGALDTFGYKEFYPMLRGERFDPEEWADLVVCSGARYAGPVTEHADNFSMWNSRVNAVNSVNYGIGRDVTGECFAAFERRGIRRLVTFHHQWLWGWFMSTDSDADVYVPENEKYYGPALPLETNRYHPYRMPDEKFNSTWRDKVLEVVHLYQPDALYFDSRANIIAEPYRHAVVNDFYRTIAQGIVTYKQSDFPGEIGVVDFERGHVADMVPHPWQVDDRLEDNVTWCMVQEPKYRSAQHVLQQLVDVVSKNGNLLLNVGPYADGHFHSDAVRILHEVGAWLSENGEAIYGTRPYTRFGEGPTHMDNRQYDLKKLDEQLKTGADAAMAARQFSYEDFRFTQTAEAVYIIAMDWPPDGICRVRSFGTAQAQMPVRKVCLSNDDAKSLDFRQTAHCLEVKLPTDRCGILPRALKIPKAL